MGVDQLAGRFNVVPRQWPRCWGLKWGGYFAENDEERIEAAHRQSCRLRTKADNFSIYKNKPETLGCDRPSL